MDARYDKVLYWLPTKRARNGLKLQMFDDEDAAVISYVHKMTETLYYLHHEYA